MKARVRYEAGHRCERCNHPYIPKGDAKLLRVEPTPYHWSLCDERCTHRAPLRIGGEDGFVVDRPVTDWDVAKYRQTYADSTIEAEWRILTVHHLDGDKANLQWWNLSALCQRCHLQIQAKVVMERVYPHEHSEWFKPHAAGWYAWIYEGREITRAEAFERMDELLALELQTA